ncbi:MAG: PAS domain S-box protein [Pontiellaceae bacterium]|nr:PAS domain S-box protein [Pontiellaceae bacterium]
MDKNNLQPNKNNELAALWMASSFMSEMMSTSDPETLAQRLAEQIRELTGAHTVLLLEHEPTGCHLIHACPARRATLFSSDELLQFCPEHNPEDPRAIERLGIPEGPFGHMLIDKGVTSFLRVPLVVNSNLFGLIALLNLPEPERLDDVRKILSLLSPFFGVTLKNAMNQQRIQQQAETLEEQVAERTMDLDNARKAALNMMEDAVRSKEIITESERRFSLLLSNLPGMAYRCKNDGNWTMEFISQACRNITGYSHEDLVDNAGISFAQLIHPEDRKQVEHTIQLAVSAKTTFEIEYRLITKSGDIRWVWERGEGVYSDTGDVLFLEGFISDITERKLAENTVKESRENLRITLNSIGDAVISTDVEGRITSMNPVAERLVGWTAQEAQGRPLEQIFRIVNEFTREPLKNPAHDVLNSGKIVGLANHALLLAKNGQEIPVADSGAPIVNDAGNITGVVLVFRDQTQERMNRRFTEFRLELMQFSANHSLDETLVLALDRAGELVESPIGFYHAVTDDQKSLILQQWSSKTMETFCKVEDHGMHYGIKMAGVWADAVRNKAPVVHNDYASLPNKKGMPEGHAKVTRELVVPVIRKQKVVSVLGIGNKPTNYTDEDVRILSSFADVIWEIAERKQTETALQQSEKQYRMLFENMTTGFALHEMIVDESNNPLDYRFLELNAAFESMIGRKAEALIGRTVKEVFPSTEPYWIETYGKVAQTGEPASIENYSKELEKHYEVRAFSPSKGQFATLVTDITERIETQKAIKESQSRLQRAQKVAHVGDWEFDLTNKTVSASDETIRIYGLGDEPVTIAEVQQIPLPQYREMLDNALSDLINENKPYTVEFTIKNPKTGRLVDVHSVAEYNAEENKIFGVIQDITARKQAELALARSEAKYRDLFEKSADAFLVFKDGKLLDCNQAAVKMIHLEKKEQLLDRRPEELSPEYQPDGRSSKEKADELIRRAHKEKTVRFEWMHQRADGSTFPVEVSLTSITDSTGDQIIHTTWRDISENKRMQEAIEKRILALTQPMDGITDIAFESLFNLEDIQRIQDDFANATHVASVILHPDGTFITKPSNFTRFCTDYVQSTQKGAARCKKWEAKLCDKSKAGSFMDTCSSAGLWEAGTSIKVAGKHLATWFIGQVRDEQLTDETVLKYGKNIGITDQKGFLQAFHDVPCISSQRFKQIAKALVSLADQLSTSAYQNIQQARFITEQKRDRNALRESQAQLQIMWNAMDVGILLIDTETHEIINANPALLKMSGHQREEVIGHLCHELICTTEKGNCPADKTEEGLERSERVLLHADGHSVDVEKTVTKISIEGRTVYLETLLDITDRLAAENRLKEISQVQSSILNNSSLGIALIENRKFIWVNPRLCELLNTDIKELSGASTRILYPSEEEYLHIGEKAYEVMADNKRFDHTLQFVQHDGTLFWCRLIGKALDPERPLEGQSIWMFEDITDRREAEEKLIRLSTAIEQSPEAIVITDLEGTILYINPAFEKTTGYLEKEVLGKTPRVLKSGEHLRSFYKEMWDTISRGKIWEGRIVNRRKNGTLFTEEASIAPVKDSNGKIVNYVAVKRDISEELVREEEFHHAQKMEAVGQLAGGIAHDFNNILQGILSFSELLLLGMDENSEEYDYANEIRLSARSAARLTQQLLAFSRKQATERICVDLNNVVHDSAALLNVLMGENIKVELNLQQNLPEIIADYGQLSQIIMNLAVNARDAMAGAGMLTISTKQAHISENDAASIADAFPGEFVCLSLQDTGCGMDQATIERIFEPFFTTKPLGSGTGLGLSVVYGIVKQNKGWINLHSELGHGTCIEIFLPLPKPADPISETDNSMDVAKSHILFAGDNPEIRELMINLLDKHLHFITMQSTTEQALEWLAQPENSVDLFISDIDLPDMDEKHFVEILHTNRPNLPILLLTVFKDSSPYWKNMEGYGIHLLNKPFTITSLLKMTSQLLKEQHQ